jgi:hypothetical protein
MYEHIVSFRFSIENKRGYVVFYLCKLFGRKFELQMVFIVREIVEQSRGISITNLFKIFRVEENVTMETGVFILRFDELMRISGHNQNDIARD